MDEFDLIRRYFRRSPRRAENLLGIGDDGAVIAGGGEPMALVTDSLVAGEHFTADAAASDIGWKALAVNLSDLAAMGATPLAFTLAISLPRVEEAWLSQFSFGLFALADEHDIDLVGGDTTRGPLSITITACGRLSGPAPLRRSGARPGDQICLTGPCGGAGWAWRQPATADDEARLRLARPQPRVAAGQALANLATAAIDVSDGLAADLGHMLKASGVGADIIFADIPAHAGLTTVADEAMRTELVLGGGEDYELCYTVKPERLEACRRQLGDACSVIGEVVDSPRLRVLDREGTPMDAPEGYSHF